MITLCHDILVRNTHYRSWHHDKLLKLTHNHLLPNKHAIQLTYPTICIDIKSASNQVPYWVLYFVSPASHVLELHRFRCNLSWGTHTSGDVWVSDYHPRGRRDVYSIRIGAISWGCNCYRINNTIRTLREFEVNLLAINKVDVREDARCTTRHHHSLHTTRFVYIRIIPYMTPYPEANPSGESTSRNSTPLCFSFDVWITFFS